MLLNTLMFNTWSERFTWWVEQFFTTEELLELYKVEDGVSVAPQHLFDKYCRLERVYCRHQKHNRHYQFN